MRHKRLGLTIFIIIVFVSSCSTSKTLLSKNKTEYGSIKFYLDNNPPNDKESKRVFAEVNNSVFYSFYPDKIIKQTRLSKESESNLIYEQTPDFSNTLAYQKLSALDSSVLIRGDRILDSLNVTNYKKSVGATGFEEIVVYYHGFPKNKRFRP